MEPATVIPLIEANEIKSLKTALEVTCPITAGINRLLVIQVQKEYHEEIAENNMPVVQHGQLWIPKHMTANSEGTKTGLNVNPVVKAVVKSIGVIKESSVSAALANDPRDLKEGDIIYVFPSVFETMVTIEGVDYFSYSNRDWLFKITDVDAAVANVKEATE